MLYSLKIKGWCCHLVFLLLLGSMAIPVKASFSNHGSHWQVVMIANVSVAHWISKHPDSDGDGMPDTWELQYGLQPDNSSDAHADHDGDGYTNLIEYGRQTNPQNATSHPQAQILQFSINRTTAHAGEELTLSWQTEDALSVRLKGKEGVLSPTGSLSIPAYLSTTHTLIVEGGSSRQTSLNLEVSIPRNAQAGPQNHFYYELDDVLYKIAPNATVVWSRPVGSILGKPIIDRQGHVYVTTTTSHLHGFDEYGDPRWNAIAFDGQDPLRVPAEIHPGKEVLYVVTQSGKLSAINAITGENIWTRQAQLSSDAIVDNPIACSSNKVYIHDSQHTLGAYDADTGACQWVKVMCAAHENCSDLRRLDGGCSNLP